jgi:hypothetical protein
VIFCKGYLPLRVSHRVIYKLYEVLTDKTAERHHQIRVVDESGEDYLYPEKYFAPVRLPSITKDKLELTAA